MTARGLFADADDARRVVTALSADGWEATCRREPFSGEDDDEDHPWLVLTDAPATVLDLWCDRLDGWLEADDAEPGTPPADAVALPDRPRRRRGDRTP